MNCRDIEPLLHAEPDGLLTTRQQADLAEHVATCAACQQRRTELKDALNAYRADVASVPVPSADDAWSDLKSRLDQPAERPVKKRPLAPVIWFGTSLAAAAALALAYLGPRAPTAEPVPSAAPVTAIAQANYVEAGDARATTMVYADQQSGWLVVWAADPAGSPQS
jgi:anti-sigma factor RsiW